MDFIDYIVISFILGIAFGIIKASITSNKKKNMDKQLVSLDDFSATQKIMGNDGNSGIAVDEKRKKICLIQQDLGGEVRLNLISYRDILSSEVFEDGVTITQTSRVSQIGGVLIGGLALGGFGAIIGGLSGKTTSSNKVNRIDLRITVNRTSNPVHDINFMNTEEKKQGLAYTESMKDARHWHGLMDVLIKRADTEDIKKERNLVKESIPAITSTSVADELVKLSGLQKQGVLTADEFATQKEKLLS